MEGLKKVIIVPLNVMRISDSCWGVMIKMAKDGNIASKSDLGGRRKIAETGIWERLRMLR
ncbi:MAG: cyclodeaminase/cyclohydrolase family protein [Ignavibacteria bacterium]